MNGGRHESACDSGAAIARDVFLRDAKLGAATRADPRDDLKAREGPA
jgi:hypothetical protein